MKSRLAISLQNLELTGEWEENWIKADREVVEVLYPVDTAPPRCLDIRPAVLDEKVGMCRVEIIVPRNIQLIGSRFVTVHKVRRRTRKLDR